MTRVAIVGTGIAGLTAARRLHAAGGVELTVFEASDRIGGHTHTVDVSVGGRSYPIDTGFIVYNQLTYPRLCALLDELGVDSQPTTMSFGVRDDASGLEYASTGVGGLFAQPGRVLDAQHWRMLADLVRFERIGRRLLARAGDEPTLDELLDRHGCSAAFRDRFLVPMGAAIWSAPPGELGRFPARSFVEFFTNHRFLRLRGQPVWRVIRGGSRRYLEPLCRPFTDRIRVRAPVERIWRRAGAVELAAGGGGIERFDHVVIACHSDQALGLLADPTAAERAVLGAIGYQANDVVLHTDAALLPRAPRARAAWNYHLTGEPGRPATVTYDMNLLQGIDAPVRFCVTLNEAAAIDPARVLGRYTYHHPVATQAARVAQGRWAELDGGGTHYAGAYWSFGFHEDGVRSGERAAGAVVAAIRAPAARPRAVG